MVSSIAFLSQKEVWIIDISLQCAGRTHEEGMYIDRIGVSEHFSGYIGKVAKHRRAVVALTHS
jgi:hypothetical protein